MTKSIDPHETNSFNPEKHGTWIGSRTDWIGGGEILTVKCEFGYVLSIRLLITKRMCVSDPMPDYMKIHSDRLCLLHFVDLKK